MSLASDTLKLRRPAGHAALPGNDNTNRVAHPCVKRAAAANGARYDGQRRAEEARAQHFRRSGCAWLLQRDSLGLLRLELAHVQDGCACGDKVPSH